MTYYSDLLVVIDEYQALEHGLAPKRAVAELRALCINILEIEPNEDIAERLLTMLAELPDDIRSRSIHPLLFEQLRSAVGRGVSGASGQASSR